MLSKVIRDSWDHKSIRNMAKRGSSRCSNPHISIPANITREELNIQLKEADRFNVFGDRFLWCYVERQALLPHGGDPLDWAEEVKELSECVQHARKQSRMYSRAFIALDDRGALDRLLLADVVSERAQQDLTRMAEAVEAAKPAPPKEVTPRDPRGHT